MGVTARAAAAVGLLVALVCALIPGIDIAVTRLFYDPSGWPPFPLVNAPGIQVARVILLYLPPLVALVALLSLVGNALGLRIARHLPPRGALFMLATLILVPGLLINAGLKEHWGRPRPAEVVEFRGGSPFYSWWQPGGPCKDNCSFVSGEVAAMAWLTAAASLAPPTVRPIAMAAAITATALTSFLRVGFGRHWFSDAVIGATLTIVLIALLRGLFFAGRPRAALLPTVPEAATHDVQP